MGTRLLLLGTAGGRQSFSPADLDSLALWLDASQISGLSDGDPVGTWADQSGNSADAAQGTATKRPLYKTGIFNGQPALAFDGADDTLTLADASACDFTTPFSVYVVADQVDAATNNRFLSKVTGSTGYELAGDLNPNTRFRTGNGSALVASVTTQIADNTCAIVGGLWDGTTQYLDLNGTIADSDSQASVATSTEKLALGATPTGGSPLEGHIAEVVIVGAYLATDDRLKLVRYLGQKYGVTTA